MEESYPFPSSSGCRDAHKAARWHTGHVTHHLLSTERIGQWAPPTAPPLYPCNRWFEYTVLFYIQKVRFRKAKVNSWNLDERVFKVLGAYGYATST